AQDDGAHFVVVRIMIGSFVDRIECLGYCTHEHDAQGIERIGVVHGDDVDAIVAVYPIDQNVFVPAETRNSCSILHACSPVRVETYASVFQGTAPQANISSTNLTVPVHGVPAILSAAMSLRKQHMWRWLGRLQSGFRLATNMREVVTAGSASRWQP